MIDFGLKISWYRPHSCNVDGSNYIYIQNVIEPTLTGMLVWQFSSTLFPFKINKKTKPDSRMQHDLPTLPCDEARTPSPISPAMVRRAFPAPGSAWTVKVVKRVNLPQERLKYILGF